MVAATSAFLAALLASDGVTLRALRELKFGIPAREALSPKAAFLRPRRDLALIFNGSRTRLGARRDE